MHSEFSESLSSAIQYKDVKKLTLILGALCVVLIGGALYLMQNGEAPASERFSTFGFKNDSVERPLVSDEEGVYGTEGAMSEITQAEEDSSWFRKFLNEVRNTGVSNTPSETGEYNPSTSDDGDTAPSGSYGTYGTENSRNTTAEGGGASTPETTNTGSTDTTTVTPATLTIITPSTGDVLANRVGSPIAKVFWTYGDLTAKITIEIKSGTRLVRTLTTMTSNSGRYTWDYSPTLADGEYTLTVKAYSPTGTLLATGESGTFEVSKTRDPKVAIEEPEESEEPTSTVPQDRDVNGNVIPSPSAPKESLGCEYVGETPSPGSGPGPCGSHQVPVGNFSSGMTGANAITRVWQYNLDYNFGAINSFRFGMQPSHGISFRFTTPSEDSAPANFFPHNGSVATNDHVSRGAIPGMHVSLSEQRGDFDYDALGGATYNPCYTTSNVGASFISYKLRREGDAPANQYECTLRPGKTYYVNIRFERADEYGRGNIQCNPTTLPTCGVVFQVN